MKVELLAPAGNFEKFKTALRYGADAVYMGGKQFSLRALSDNFTLDEMAKATRIAHESGKKVYVAANTFARNSDLGAAREYFSFLREISADAALITDPGLIALARRCEPSLKVHLSTQANTLNSEAVKFWKDIGVSRIVLARELSIKEIAEIHAACDIELEAFVHGAMCISYSGRCLLSNYLNGRDANKGECVQACRWSYDLREHAKGGDYLTLEEDVRGSYILNSKDLNMIYHLPKLIGAGVSSLKIEGRMKSEYYVATVVNAYRRALDEYYENGEKYLENPLYGNELECTVHRAFTTAYMLGNDENTVNLDNSQSSGAADFAAAVLGYDGAKGFALIEMRNRFKQGDVLEVLSPNKTFGQEIKVAAMENEEGEMVTDAKLVQQRLKLYTAVPVQEGDFLRKRRKTNRFH